MIVSHLLLILHKKIQFYIFMFEAWNVAKGRQVQGGRILSQGTVNRCMMEMERKSWLSNIRQSNITTTSWPPSPSLILKIKKLHRPPFDPNKQHPNYHSLMFSVLSEGWHQLGASSKAVVPKPVWAVGHHTSVFLKLGLGQCILPTGHRNITMLGYWTARYLGSNRLH
jgi:hypothetical protein